MKEECPGCGGQTIIPRPPKYSPDDRYSKYRRMAKEDRLRKEGLI
jgi:H/ACA ribonucleoprotein complex subunit 3